MKPLRTSFFLVSLAGILLMLPGAAVADVLTVVPTAKFDVSLTANGVKNGINIGPGQGDQSANVTLQWSAGGATNCISNWKSELVGTSGTLAGTLPLSVQSRAFGIICFGPGAAKGAKVTVTVTKPDLIVQQFTLSGAEPFMQTVQGKSGTPPTTNQKANTWKARDPAAYVLNVTLKNNGKFGAQAAELAYQWSTTKAADSWVTMATKPVGAVAAGQPITAPPVSFPARSEAGKKYYFRVCVDPDNKVMETNEKNNCSSRPLGPYIFE